MKSARYWLAPLAIAVIALGVFAAKWVWWPSAERLVSAVKQASRRGDPEEARRLALRAVALYPNSSAVRLTAAEIELGSQRREEALAHLEHVPDDGSVSALMAIGNAGDLLFELHRLTEAERRFRRVLKLDSKSLTGSGSNRGP